jgi:hypothetical protein
MDHMGHMARTMPMGGMDMMDHSVIVWQPHMGPISLRRACAPKTEAAPLVSREEGPVGTHRAGSALEHSG